MTRFAGYAAIFDRPDKGGDIVRRGAFARAKLPIPLFDQHDATRRIGTLQHLSEDKRGLRVIAQMEGNRSLSPGAGLSFGYRVRGMNMGTYRELIDVDLIEVSVVTNPMQPLARVLAVQSEGESNGL